MIENPESAGTPPAPVSFAEAFWYWLKLGFISFGGPTGQIAIMHQDLVERRRWISEKRFLHALNYCMVLPGPEATQLATYIGWMMHRTRGGIAAGVLFVLPSLLLLIALSWVYMVYGRLPVIAGVLYGIKPAVTAIVVFAAYRIGSRALKNAALWSLAAAAFVAIFALKVPFPFIVLAAGVIGYFGGRLAPAKFAVGGGHAAADKSYGAALIDVSPLFKYDVSGRDAAAFVDRLITRDARRLAVGQVIYTPWCDDDGNLVDDGTVARRGEQEFFWTAADATYRWLLLNADRKSTRLNSSHVKRSRMPSSA